ncbi:MAG: hypothetical protein ACJ798_19225 [Phenylobacterium sp.]
MPSAIGAAHAHIPAANLSADKPLNPAQAARAADPTAKGAAFGALVSSLAKAKHAPPQTPPVDETAPTDPVVTDPLVTGDTGTVIDLTA